MMNENFVSKPDMLINGSTNMQASAFDILDMTIPYISADVKLENRTYILSVRDIFNTIGLPYDRFMYRKYKALAHKDASVISIAFVDEYGREVQLMPFDKITWHDESQSVEVNISESFKEIMADPTQTKTKYRLIDFLALKSKYAKQAFAMLMVRYTKSNAGKRLIEFKHDGSLKGNLFLEIWPIKKTRTTFRLKENTYRTANVRALFKQVCAEITASTDYNAEVEFNYYKNTEEKNAQSELTHICWKLAKKTRTPNISDNESSKYLIDIMSFGYDRTDAMSLSAALVKNGEDMKYFKKLHENLKKNNGLINNKIGWLLTGIEKHYSFNPNKADNNNAFNNFSQRSYDYDELETKLINKGMAKCEPKENDGED